MRYRVIRYFTAQLAIVNRNILAIKYVAFDERANDNYFYDLCEINITFAINRLQYT